MNNPLCEICANKNRIVDIMLEPSRIIRCLENESCPGFERNAFPLNFEEALLSMIKDWEICECENGEQWRFNHEFSLFEILHKDSWGASAIEVESQARRWKVVE